MAEYDDLVLAISELNMAYEAVEAACPDSPRTPEILRGLARQVLQDLVPITRRAGIEHPVRQFGGSSTTTSDYQNEYAELADL